MGLSIVVNACLLALMAHAFTAPDGPARRYLAVELQVPTQVAVHHVTKPQIKQIVLPASPPKPIAQPVPQRPITAKPLAQPEPVSKTLGSKQEMRTSPVRMMPSLALPQTHTGSSAGSGPGIGASADPGARGGTSSTGPGVYVGSGSGTGGEHGSGSSPSVPANGNGHGSQPAPTHEVRPAAPEPPKPAPRGESRGARISRQSKPAYPSSAREDGVEGTVILEVSIGADGRATSARVDRSSGDRRLDRAAADAVQQWSYEPSLKDGVPVSSSMRVRVEFRLE